MNWTKQAQQIKAIVLDIDGTFTDGGVGYGFDFPVEFKIFDIKDGRGVYNAHLAGLKVCALTGRTSSTNNRRLNELKFEIIRDGCQSKDQGLREICQQLGITPENCMVIGDDLIDLPAMALAGISVAVGDAVPIVRELADWVTEKHGGHGAVREAIDRLLKYQGKLDAIHEPFYQMFSSKKREE